MLKLECYLEFCVWVLPCPHSALAKTVLRLILLVVVIVGVCGAVRVVQSVIPIVDLCLFVPFSV